MTELDLQWLARVDDGSYFMVRGMTGEWLLRMVDEGMIRRRRPCETNGWIADYVLTPEGRLAIKK